jgi:hypothetical protein
MRNIMSFEVVVRKQLFTIGFPNLNNRYYF